MANRGPIGNGLYAVCKALLWGALAALARVRYFNVPDIRKRRGGLLIASNHQSFLDPLLIGMALSGPIRYLARRSLFGVPGLGRLIWALGAHPVTRGTVDSGAVKTVMRLLREGEAVLVFPEGTRSRNGSLGRFKPGAAAIAARCGVPLLPVCVEGAHECWPRSRTLPRPGRAAVAFGEPIATEGMSPEELTERLCDEIIALRASLRDYLGRPGRRGSRRAAVR